MGERNVTNHGKAKLAYTRWVYGKSLIHRLRNEYSFSLTEVSRIAGGHGDTPGWAAAAMQNRSIMHEHQIRAMESYMAAPKKGGAPPTEQRLTPDQQKEFGRMLERLQLGGWSNQQIADALGYNAPSIVSDIKGGRVGSTLSRLQTVTQLCAQLAVGEPSTERAFPEPPRPITSSLVTEAQRHQRPTTEPAPDVLQTAIDTGEAFLAALKKLEDAMPAFARKAARDLRARVEALVQELTADEEGS